MSLAFAEWKPTEAAALIDFITADSYPFNLYPNPTREQVARWIDDDLFTQTFWIFDDRTPIGVLQQQDLSATTFEIHLRLHAIHRGKGHGSHAIRWFTGYLFEHFPAKHRIEGWTRADNMAMRTVFRRCGYAKEAHLRQDFPADDGRLLDKVGYAILRSDWAHQTMTPVDWNDEPELLP